MTHASTAAPVKTPQYDYSALSLKQLIRIQESLGAYMRERFETPTALLHAHLIGFGRMDAAVQQDAARRLSEAFAFSLANEGGFMLQAEGPRLTAAARSGVAGARALMNLMGNIAAQNVTPGVTQVLGLRCAMLWGPSLVDGEHIEGDLVRRAHLLGDTAGAGEIRLSLSAYDALPPTLRERCTALGDVTLSPGDAPLPVLRINWFDANSYPTGMTLKETGAHIPLPFAELTTMGRLAQYGGSRANDIVLRHALPSKTSRISRCHCSLERDVNGYVIRRLSSGSVVVDGTSLEKGQATLLKPDSTVVLGEALTLAFHGPNRADATAIDATVMGTFIETSVTHIGI